jgi:hypothetical protein
MRATGLDLNPLSLLRKAVAQPQKVPRFLANLLSGQKYRDYQQWQAFLQSDIYLVTFPKCGRTWLRNMLGQLIHEHYGLPPSIKPYLDDELLAATPQVKLAVTHDTPTYWLDYQQALSTKKYYQGKKVIFLKRDMRDTLVSWYHHLNKRKGSYPGTLSEFLHTERDGIGAKCALVFQQAWYDSQKLPAQFLVLNYEDLHLQPLPSLRAAAQLIGLEGLPESSLEQAIRASSFDNMRQQETQGQLRVGTVTSLEAAQRDPNTFFVRKGKMGGWRDELSAGDVAYLEGLIQNLPAPREWFLHPAAE